MVRKILFSIGLLFTFFNLFAQKNVVEYFRLMPDNMVFYYPLKYENGKWVSYSSAEYEIYPVVDIKNGYIEIEDEGTGGGTVRLQVVLFRKADKQAVLGISYILNDGVNVETKINFYKYENGKWQNITSSVLPEIDYSYFVKKGYSPQQNIKDFYELEYDLPRYGTTVSVRIWDIKAQMICNGLLSDQKQKNKTEACNFINNIDKNQINLKWDRSKGKFIIN